MPVSSADCDARELMRHLLLYGQPVRDQHPDLWGYEADLASAKVPQMSAFYHELSEPSCAIGQLG